jgi:adenylate cyclase
MSIAVAGSVPPGTREPCAEGGTVATDERLLVPGPHPAREGPGMHDPRELGAEVPLVERAFAFLDLCGFTRYMADHGEHAAIDAVTRFRALTRRITTQRGVRTAKWLGDGAMIVGVDVGPTIAAAAEVIARYDGRTLALRGGVAHGQVLLFDGDDYLGRPANLAARLCQAARPGELLAVGYPPDALPTWVAVAGRRDLTLRGIGRLKHVQQLALVSDSNLPTLTAGPGS